MRISLKLHYAKFDVSSLFCSKVIEDKSFGVCLTPLGKGRVNPISPGGGFRSPGETLINNSKTAKDTKMKFFKFNLTLIGVILYIMTILFNLRCFMATICYECVVEQKSEETCIFARILACSCSNWVQGGIFGF